MWACTVIVETAKDRLLADCTDPTPDVDAVYRNQKLFAAAQDARLIQASPLRAMAETAAVPARRARMQASHIAPWRPDISLDQRPVVFRQDDLPQDSAAAFEARMALAFDAAADAWPDPLPAFAPDAAPLPMETFALIDAAKSVSMPEAVAGSGLDYRSLFAGEAATDLADVAPYLVRLDPDAPLTRALLSGDPAPAGLWSEHCTMILRSRLGLSGLRRSLRPFLKLSPDTDGGQPLFFRFYDAAVFRNVVPAMDPHVHQTLLAGVDLIIAPGDRHAATALMVHRGQLA